MTDEKKEDKKKKGGLPDAIAPTPKPLSEKKKKGNDLVHHLSAGIPEIIKDLKPFESKISKGKIFSITMTINESFTCSPK